MSSLGASVETAADGAIGVAQFRQSSERYYDLVLMDVQMPNMNGYEATRQIRTLPRQDSSTIPIIAMTADAFAEDVEATRKTGMNSHLPKPFNLDSLRKKKSAGSYRVEEKKDSGQLIAQLTGIFP